MLVMMTRCLVIRSHCSGKRPPLCSFVPNIQDPTEQRLTVLTALTASALCGHVHEQNMFIVVHASIKVQFA